MADPGRLAADGSVRRRLSLVVAAYLVAAVGFGLLGVAGLRAVAGGQVAFGVPWTVAATGTVAGVLTIALAAARARTARITTAVALAGRGRVMILLAAVGTAVAAVVTAPVGDDELTFVLAVNAGLAVAVALFAALATDVSRVVPATLPPAVDG